MKLTVYSVQDLVANTFSFPFYERSPNQALSVFKQVCGSPDSLFHQFPDSYRLLKIGTFDDEGGTFENFPHEVICFASDFVSNQSDNS